MDDASPGERAFWWLRSRLSPAASRPALVAAVFSVAGSVALMTSAIVESVSFGSGFRERLLVASSGFGSTSQLLLLLAAVLVVLDVLSVASEGTSGAGFYALAVLGGVGVGINLAEMASTLTESGLPPVGAGTLAEGYTVIVLNSVVPALLGAVPIYVGVTRPRIVLGSGR